MNTQHRRPRRVVAAVAAAALAGGGAGAGIYAGLSGSGSPAPTAAAPAPAAPATQDASSSSELSVSQIYKQNSQSVVEVDVTSVSGNDQPFPFGGQREVQGQGTGWVYDSKGDIVTNQHVVDGATKVRVTFQDGSTYTAKVIGTDPSTDVAVIRVDAPASELHPLTLGDSSKVGVGDGVVAIGDPFGLDNTVTAGIVSAVGREISAPNNAPIPNAIQTDAAINHGNSGGPLFNLEGQVIGVTAQIESDSGGNDGIGFAIPSNTVKSIADQLIAKGSVEHALLGVQVQTVPTSAASQLGGTAGVAVQSVQSGSAASKAGLKGSTGSKTVAGVKYPTGGDVITAFNGTKVTGADQLRALIDTHKPGDKVTLTLVRGGKSRAVDVTLGKRSS
jgi:putative serine protease PepD